MLSPRRKRQLGLAVLVALAVALRLERGFRHPDFLEDGYHHWWISAKLLERGVYVDPFAEKVLGMWLPGYHVLSAGVLGVFGTFDVPAMRVVNVLVSGGTLLVVHRLAERERPGSGWFAAGLFAIYPFAIIVAPIPIPMTVATFLVTAGAYLVTSHEGPARWWVGGGLLALAGLFRYEAWVIAAALGVWVLVRRGRSAVAPFAVPAAVFLAWGVVVTALQEGWFLDAVFGQAQRELARSVETGFIPSGILARLWLYAKIYLPATLPTLGLAGIAVARDPVRWHVAAAASMGAAVIALVVGGVGWGSVRYLQPMVPLACVLAGEGLALAWDSAHRVQGRPLALGLVALMVGIQGWATASELDYVDQFGEITFLPRERAGAYLADHADPGSEALVLSESPYAAWRSGLDPERLWGTSILPANRSQAEDYLAANVSYLVHVEEPPEKFPFMMSNQLWPGLADGDPPERLERAFNATGWERAYGGQEVIVYRVQP